MFSKSARREAAARPVGALSVVAAEARITGDVTSPGELHVDGHVEGNIRCHTLVVGEAGTVCGDVVAEVATVHGTLTGRIDAESVSIARTAKVTGDIRHSLLSVEAGARIDGRCCVNGPPAEEQGPLRLAVAGPN